MGEIILNKCSIWGTQAHVELMQTDSHRVNSPRAGGVYILSRTCAMTVGNLSADEKKLLTSWLVQERARENMEPQLPYSTQLEKFVNKLQPLTVPQRADNLLKYIESKIPNIEALHSFGRDIAPGIDEEMLAWSESMEINELRFLLKYLQERGWLERAPDDPNPYISYRLTVAGYSYLSELKNKRVIDSSQAFVAMWFDKTMDKVWEDGIETGIKEAGYKPMRIDKREHLNKIDDEIIAEIRRSKFVVADFTAGGDGARGGVYYEAGFAHGLNIPVIFTCRKDLLEKIHFDIRQYPYIVWEDHKELKSRLTQRIAAVIGDGPEKV